MTRTHTHRRRRRAAVMFTGLAIAIGLAPAATAEAPVTVVKVAKVKATQKPAGVAWLGGRVVHSATGRRTALPWTAKQADQRHLRLLGRTAKGWLVKDFTGDRWNVYLVSHGKRHRLSSHSVTEGEFVSIVLSDRRGRYAVRYYDEVADDNLVAVYDLTGRQVAARTFPNAAEILDFTGPRMVVGEDDTYLWDIDAPQEDDDDGVATGLGVDAVTANIAHDLLFVTDDATGESGPTSLADPGTPSWTAPMTSAIVSPDGQRVLTHDQGLTSQFRSVATGAVSRTLKISYLSSDRPVWAASGGAIVFVGSVNGLGDVERLVRCTTGGRCTGPGPRMARDRLSLPVSVSS